MKCKLAVILAVLNKIKIKKYRKMKTHKHPVCVAGELMGRVKQVVQLRVGIFFAF